MIQDVGHLKTITIQGVRCFKTIQCIGTCGLLEILIDTRYGALGNHNEITCITLEKNTDTMCGNLKTIMLQDVTHLKTKIMQF